MAENLPPGLSGFMAFLEVPVMEALPSVADVVGKIVLRNGKLFGALSLTQPLLKFLGGKKSDRDTQNQEKEDGKHVLTVAKAIKIVDQHISGFRGTLEEAADLTQFIASAPTPGTGGKGLPTLLGQISEDLRKAALRQNKPRLLELKVVSTRKP